MLCIYQTPCSLCSLVRSLSLAYGCGYSAYLFSLFISFFLSSFLRVCVCVVFFLSSHFYYMCRSIFLQFIYIYTSWWLENKIVVDEQRLRMRNKRYKHTYWRCYYVEMLLYPTNSMLIQMDTHKNNFSIYGYSGYETVQPLNGINLILK